MYARIAVLTFVLSATMPLTAQAQATGKPSPPAPQARTQEIVITADRPTHYPPALSRAGVQGTAIVRATFKPDGAVGKAAVETTSRSKALDDAALSVVRELKAPPQSSSQVLLVPVTFRKDTAANLKQKSCADLNTDLAYSRSVFPEVDVASRTVFNLATGMLVMSVSGQSRVTLAKGIKKAITTSIAMCELQPGANFWTVFRRAAEQARAN